MNGTNKIATLPNIISIARILLSPMICFTVGNKSSLLLLLIIIGFTDFFDGYIARKLNKQTLFGAWLDSVADFVFFLSFIVYALLFEAKIILEPQFYVPVLIIVFIKLLSAITGFRKYKRPGFLHTFGNKMTTLITFIGIGLFVLFRYTVVVEIGLYVSILSSLEEFTILLIGNRYDPNIKWIWDRRLRIKRN